MQPNRVGSKSGQNHEIPRSRKSMSSLYESDGEGESSLNPYALEFIPSYLKCGKSDKGIKSTSQKMKTEATSTTTLVQREIGGDASYLHAQRQLFEMLHQLGEKLMPLKAIKVSLSTDGQGINVQFKADQDGSGKQMLDESLCQDSALHLEMSDRSLIPRRLPNVLAAKFMVRMGDVLNDKMEWNENNDESIAPKSSPLGPQPTAGKQLETKSSMGSKLSMESKFASEGKLLIERKRKCLSIDSTFMQQLPSIPTSKESLPKTRKQNSEPLHLNGVLDARPSIATKVYGSVSAASWNRVSKTESYVKPEPKIDHVKISSKGIHTPRQSLGQIIKKGLTGQKFVPRSTHTSQMRQTQVQKRMNSLKTVSN